MSKPLKTIGNLQNADPTQFLIDLKHKFQTQNKKYTINSIKCNSDSKYSQIQKKRQSSNSQEKKVRNQVQATKDTHSNVIQNNTSQIAILQQQLELQASNQAYIEQLHKLIDQFNVGGDSYLAKLENIWKDYILIKEQIQKSIIAQDLLQQENQQLKYQLQCSIKDQKELLKVDLTEQSFQSTIDQEQILKPQQSVVDFRINQETTLSLNTQQEELMKIFQMFQNSDSQIDLCGDRGSLSGTPISQKFNAVLQQSIHGGLSHDFKYSLS